MRLIHHAPKSQLTRPLSSYWLLAVGLFLSAAAASSQPPPKLGEPVSPQTWEAKTQEFKGKYTLFTFWEVTCEPCIEEMPGLIEVYRKLKPKGLEIVAVNTDPEGRFEAAAKLIETLDLPFIALYKEPGSDVKFRQAVDPEYGANPFALLFNPQGEKIRKFPSAHTQQEWMDYLEPLVSGVEEEAAPSVEAAPDLPAGDPFEGIAELFPSDKKPAAKTDDPFAAAFDKLLPKIEEKGAPKGPPGNPFKMQQPTWKQGGEGELLLSLPYTSETEGHLLLSTFAYEKLSGKGIALGTSSVSKLDKYYMAVIDATEEILYTPGEVFIPLLFKGDRENLPIPFEIRFTSQGCTDGPGGACFPPDTYIVSGELAADEGGGLKVESLKSRHHDPFEPLPEPVQEEEKPAADSATASDDATGGGKTEAVQGRADSGLIERTLNRSLFLLFGLAFFGGILTSLTPCVYPMIPATVAIFGAREVNSTLQSISLAATYILGVALSYASLGLIAAGVGTVFGDLMENPWVIGVVAFFYVVLALSMLDVFTFYLPSSWVTAATRVNGRGYLPAFMMGLVSSVVFAPCGEPILLGLLTWVAKTQDFFLGFWLLFVYAWGIGVLFFIIAVFSSSLRYLPKAGAWMVAVKDFFGLLLLGLAIYWLRFILPLEWTLGLLTVYLLGSAAFIHTKNHENRGWARGVLSFATLAALLFASLPLHRLAAMQGWIASPGIAAVDGGPVVLKSAVPPHKERWLTDTPLADLEAARAKGIPAILDFRTNVCPKCDEIEAHVFADAEVQRALEGFATIQVNLSDRGVNEEVLQLQKQHQVLAVPVIVFYDSEGNLLEDKTIADTLTADDFLRLIRDIS